MTMREYNFSRVIKWLGIILAFIVIVYFIVTFYAIYQLTSNSVTALSDNINVSVDNISTSLDGIEAMMLSEVGYDKDLNKLAVAEEYRYNIDEYAIGSRIKIMISNWSKELPYTINYAIYFPENKIVIDDSDTNAEYNLWRQVKKQLLKKIEDLDFGNGWNIVKLGEEYYLLNVVSNMNRYMFSYIRLQEVVNSMQSEVYGNDYYFVIADNESNVFYNENKALEDNVLEIEKSSKSVEVRYMKQQLVINRSMNENFNLTLIVNNYISVLNIFGIQSVLLILVVGVVIMILIMLRLVNNNVLRPIRKFNENIETLKNGDVYDVETHYQVNELGNASKLMRDMIDKIKCLKIDIYEKNLEQQKAKMDFLTLQIEPHFYLNCLNIIYNMAQMHQYKQIQHLSNCISEYMRYIFKNREGVSTLRSELKHIQKYLEIQKIRYGDCFEFEIAIEDSILDINLPPLLLQTFVENSIKYTINWDDEIKLLISGHLENHTVVIKVEDNGDGFDDMILYNLNNGIDISNGQNRIGIMNAISRLKMFVGETANISFYNCISGGAGVEIKIPK